MSYFFSLRRVLSIAETQMVDVYAPRTREEVTVQLAYLVLWLRSLIIYYSFPGLLFRTSHGFLEYPSNTTPESRPNLRVPTSQYFL